MENCINPEFLATASNMKFKNEVTSKLINNAFECAILGEKYETFQDLLSTKGWLKVFRNDIIIEELVTKVIATNPKIVRKYVKTGKPKLLQELVQEVLSENSILDGGYVKEFIVNKLNKKST